MSEENKFKEYYIVAGIDPLTGNIMMSNIFEDEEEAEGYLHDNPSGDRRIYTRFITNNW